MRSNEDPKAGDRTVLVWHRTSPIRVAKRFWRGLRRLWGYKARPSREGRRSREGGVDGLFRLHAVERDIIASV